MRKYQKILILFLLLIYLGNCFCGCESITGPNVQIFGKRLSYGYLVRRSDATAE